MEHISVATYIFSGLTIVAQIISLLLLYSLIHSSKIAKKVLCFFKKYGLLLGFTVALVSMLGSLFYSEIAKYTPCVLCWYQRILMYPQVILLGIAFIKKESHIAPYSIVLSGIGAAFALYHYLLQVGTIGEILPCTTVGYSVSCVEKFVMTFGYITIPMMSLSAFILILLLMVVQKKVA